jgi:ABC-type multidrug transport system fused ATPase/permease subunit
VLAIACLLFSTAARADEVSPLLRLQPPVERQYSASLLLDPTPVPESMQHAILGDIPDQMDQNVDAFRQSLDNATVAGGGDGSSGLVFLAGLLGFIPGFGLGHLVSGHIGGFVIFLIIDLVLAGVFFGIFPVLAFAFWYLPGIIVFVAERIVEAVFAANAAMSPVYGELEAPPHDGPAPVEAGLRVLSF